MKVYRFDEFNKLPGAERDEAYRQWREDYKKRMGVEAAPLGEHYNHIKDEKRNVYREISEATSKRKKEELEELRKQANEIDLPIDRNRYKAIVSVLMLKEG